MKPLVPPEVVAQFDMTGAAVTATHTGRIHETCVADGTAGRWILQRINTDIFTDPDALMENAQLTRHCMVSAGAAALDYRTTASGSLLAAANDGGVWRSYGFVEGTVTPRPAGPAQVAPIAMAFGEFASALELHHPTEWHPVLPRFHDHGRRVGDLRTAVAADPVDRVGHSRDDIGALEDVIAALESFDEFAAWGQLPTRTAHHDAKAVNAVAPAYGARPTILDLDTVMAGTILSDIGELVRSCARRADDPTIFLVDNAKEVATSFLSGWNRELSAAERTALPIAGLMMTAQNAMRFMTDHFLGDQYYTNEPGTFPNLATSSALTAFAHSQITRLDELRRHAATV